MEAYMKKVLEKYEKLRGLREAHAECPFWDVVVITTADQDQQLAYELQIQTKLEHRELPGSCDYVVLADPPGCNGGATLSALSHLYEKYTDKLFQLKVLLLHSGGQSQRLPSASVPGKIFTLLPFGKPIYQMLDLQLAIYIPFVEKMPAGVLLISSDTILTFDIDGFEDKIRFSEVTAIAHISPIEVGVNHGVYVIEGAVDTSNKVEELKCKNVMQKPTVNKIIDSGAVLELPGDNGTHVYTDSIFYFNHSITKKFLAFYDEIKPMSCEIDAYGDFLQPLGSAPIQDYVHNAVNISSVPEALVDIRRKLFNLLKGTDFNILALNVSGFHHIGTTKEYLYHLCGDQLLSRTFDFSKRSFTLFNDATSTGCVMHSIVDPFSEIKGSSVVEFCRFEHPVRVNDRSIISNCVLSRRELEDISFQFKDRVIELPGSVFIHTVPVMYNSVVSYVTMFFGIDDDMKRKPDCVNEQSALPFLNTTLKQFATVTNVPLSNVLPDMSTRFSLWNCSLFPVCNTMTESFIVTIQAIAAMRDPNSPMNLRHYTLMSAADILKCKDIHAMLSYRKQLYNDIREEML